MQASLLIQTIKKLPKREQLGILVALLTEESGQGRLLLLHDLAEPARGAPAGSPLLEVAVDLAIKVNRRTSGETSLYHHACKRLLQNPRCPAVLVDHLIEQGFGTVLDETVEVEFTRDQKMAIVKRFEPSAVEDWVRREASSEDGGLDCEIFTVFFKRWYANTVQVDKKTGRMKLMYYYNSEPILRLLVERHQPLEPAMLRQLHSIYDQPWKLLNHPMMPVDALESAINTYAGQTTTDAVNVLDAVLSNPSTPEHYLYFYHPNQNYWDALAKNPALPEDLGMVLAAQGATRCIEAMIKNKGLKASVWQEAMRSGMRRKVYELATLPRQDDDNLHALLDDPRMDDRLLVELFEFLMQIGINGEWRSIPWEKEFMFRVIRNDQAHLLATLAEIVTRGYKPATIILKLMEIKMDWPGDMLLALAPGIKGGSADAQAARRKMTFQDHAPISVLKKYARLNDFSVSGNAIYRLNQLKERGTPQ